ncbi:SdiA-regulated domain-containing protein [Ichthyenterobacterium sp. W332]|uniref:SdiA-regulated domain-containing protein n=1 Tax=Microcosmobacter mediterraneus TaxID=3075607 RepID=A0ABU2YL35_9FLAO|nr:SdiA-regulated domain-containing protein [Ichthyenterobacterium sp. W332]MDT0558540.1 SdiA-regulated domain-containing protein [Ichthyenterobacterium sp. W332]
MDIPMAINEVSGIAFDHNNNLFWMVNDSGNKPILYGVNSKGQIIKELKIKAKNRDWEDLTMDPEGNVYIGNFGNNDNDSRQLSIYKISKDSLQHKTVTPEIIAFSYPEQLKFPPKKKKRHFDSEAFFFFKDSLYLFTKSRSPKEKGLTKLYQLPSVAGNYSAKYLDEFKSCDNSGCWITSADINADGTKIVLLNEKSAYVFSNFKGHKFLKGSKKFVDFKHSSQKESVCFKNDSILYIADEYLGVEGGNLYEIKIPNN